MFPTTPAACGGNWQFCEKIWKLESPYSFHMSRKAKQQQQTYHLSLPRLMKVVIG